MSERIHIRLFLASGHLSPEACKAFMDGSLRQDVAALAEAHLSECAFCREGLAGLQKADVHGDLHDTLMDLQLRIRQHARERESVKPVFSLRRQTLRWAPAAAAAILVAGLIFSFFLIDLEPLRSRMALAGEYNIIPEDRDMMTLHPPQPAMPALDSSTLEQDRLLKEPAMTDLVAMNVEQETAYASEKVEDTFVAIITEEADDKALTAPAAAVDAPKDHAMEKAAGVISDGGVTLQEMEEVAIVSGTRTQQKPPRLNKDVFTTVEKMPAFPGGTPALQAYLIKAIQLPPDATPVNVVVQFVVDEKGKVRDAEVVKGMSSDIDKAVLRAVRRMPDWSPGYQRDVAVKTRMVLPVKITPENK